MGCMEDQKAKENTDKELWSRDTSDEEAEEFKSYASISVTVDNSTMILCLGGRCVGMPIEKWHEMAMKSCKDAAGT